MTLDLSSVRAKLAWAEHHTQTLKDEILKWRDRVPYSLSWRINSEATRHSVMLAVTEKPDLVRWSLIAADAIHALRCALDHLMYAVAVHEFSMDPPPNGKRIAFVICDTENDLKSKYWRIKELSTGVRDAVVSLQPYKRTHEMFPPLLGLLRDLDDADKHKLLTLIIAQPSHHTFAPIVNVPQNASVTLVIHVGASVADGDEVAAIQLDRPAPDLKFNFQLVLSIAIRHAIGPKGQSLTPIVDLINDFLIPEVTNTIDTITAVVTA